MEHTIEIVLTKDRFPKEYETVIVDGGIAMWNGTIWTTRTGTTGIPIAWPVLWWTPLLYLNDKLPKGE